MDPEIEPRTPLIETVDLPLPYQLFCSGGKWWGPRDRQPIIALHGWQDNSATFDPLAPMLPDHISILSIDMIGHGRSSHYPSGQIYYFHWEAVKMLRRIILHYGWKNLTLMGHSRGGAISFLYAAIYNDEVDKLICLDIAYPKIETPETIANSAGSMIDRLLKFETFNESNMPCYGYNEMINIVENAYGGSINTESAKILMNRGMRPTKVKRGAFTFNRDIRLKVSSMLGMVPIEFSVEFAKHIKCEYLNIQANQGNYFNNDLYNEVLEIIKGNAKYFEHHEVDGTHHVHLNNPERVSGIISKFLTRDISSS